jgi:signal transduction histidine kinase
VPIRDQAGKVARWYGTCSDIHDSKLLEHSMRESAVELERIVDERTIALRRLSSRLMAMQDDERRRIARELHDGLGQEMVALKMMLNGISRQAGASLEPQITEADRLINHATQQIRTMSHLLHPPLLDEVGLMSALRWYLDGLTQRSGIGIELEMHPHDFPRLALDLETAIFRIIQEALTNVFRHSGASNVDVSLLKREGEIEIKIHDDGKGVAEDIVNMRAGSTGVGIGGMNERAKEFGGELRVTNAHPGTIVQVVIPIPAIPSAVPARAEKMAVLRTKVRPGVGLQ